jgi:hypothetical protein
MYISKEYCGIHKKYEGAIHHVHNASGLCYIGWFLALEKSILDKFQH